MTIFSKWKIRAKNLKTIIALTILEIILILWYNDWKFHPVIIATLVQFSLIFERRDVWSRLTKKEKKEVLLDEDDVENFVKGVEVLIKKGKTSGEILEKIKKN